jgi:hypothetical protein
MFEADLEKIWQMNLKNLKKLEKNVGSIITTNYDGLIENILNSQN